ncbi:NAD(P)/FAD-dependent oxidoreductase [Mesorhizobium sp.]|jgi:flavin-dependent dehydrogenase|uniref:flavin-dependent monooxygenase QhpG n=1 Tax=Mesorhizobium sp. TaxID=1871066 RepID=UPI0035664E9F
MAARQRFDCIVIGGGVSAAVAARRLAEFGLDVCLLHQSEPREQRVVESVAKGSLVVLERLGIADCIAQARIPQSAGTSVRWAGEATETAAEAASIIVRRAAVRTALLHKAVQCGAVVRAAKSIHKLHRHGMGWLAEADCPDGQVRIEAKLAIFAGGRHGPKCGRRRRLSQVTLAVTGQFGLPGAAARGCVEATAHAWFWAAPLAGGIQVTAFAAPDHPSLAGGATLEDGLRRLIAGSELLGHLAAAPLANPVTVCDASPTIVEPCVDDHFVAIGDAAFTIDPLSSQGMTKAIVSAEQGAIAANTLLQQSGRHGAAKRFHLDRTREAPDWDRRASAAHYARQAAVTPTPFWLSRAEGMAQARHRQADCPPLAQTALIFDAAASFAPEPVIRGQMIDEETALHHPRLARPIAFVGNVPIGALLADLPRSMTAAELVQLWSTVIGDRAAMRLLKQLWDDAVLVPAKVSNRAA